MFPVKEKDTGRDRAYRAYCLTIEEEDDLRMLIAHLRGFQDTAIANNKKMIVEIWFCQDAPP